MSPEITREIRRVNRHRQFPVNTCGASRYVELIGRTLVRGKRHAQIEEEPEDVGLALLSVCGSLYQARTEIARLKSRAKSLGR